MTTFRIPQPLMVGLRAAGRIGIVAGFVLALLAAPLAAPAAPAQAADGVRFARPAATGDCSSWANACTLSAALSGAAPGNEVWAAGGVYTPTMGIGRNATFTLAKGVAIYGGFGGITETLRSQRDWLAYPTTLSGDIGATGVMTDNVYHVVTIASGVTETARLDGFAIAGGQADYPMIGYLPAAGGGIYEPGGYDQTGPSLANLIVRDNFATQGGGMYIGNYDKPSLTQVTFSHNRAEANGGGMYKNSVGRARLTDVTFSENEAGNGSGGGLSISGPIYLNRVVFSRNSAYSGGGAFSSGGVEEYTPDLVNVVFSGNTAMTGGGMYNYVSSPRLTNVVFNGNWAYQGGGMDSNAGSPQLTNVIFSGNIVESTGGGMLNESDYHAEITRLVNVTFSGNWASQGSAVYNQWSQPQLVNCVIWGNRDYSGPQFYPGSGAPSLNYSLVQGGWSGAGEHNLAADPRFVRLPSPGPDGAWGLAGSSGGADDDYGDLHPGPGSPAFDAGDNAALPLDSLDLDADGVLTETLPLDLDGGPRLLSLTNAAPAVDLGVYETKNTPPMLDPLATAQTLEDTPLTIPFTVSDEQTLTADLAVKAAAGNPALVGPSGLALGGSGAGRSLTITPTADLNGFAPITLTISDGGLTTTLGFTLTVVPVNDAPSCTPLGSGNVRVPPEARPYQAAWAGAITPGPADESDQTLSFILTNDNPLLFSQAPTITLEGGMGILRFTPAPKIEGVAHLTLTLQDSLGGRSPVYPFTITVLPWQVFLPIMRR